MYDTKNRSIWKQEEKRETSKNGFEQVDISELNLSVRSFNCLKRANCNTVGDILQIMGEEGDGLRKIRNLGMRSEAEIRETLEALRNDYSTKPMAVTAASAPEGSGSTGDIVYSLEAYRRRKIVRPAKKIWEREITDFHLSKYAEGRLHSCGVNKIADLYATNPKQEPGWYAVRELFSKIASMS